jgi:hypothetical protein
MQETKTVILLSGQINRRYLWDNPKWLFFFGDNVAEWGRKGHAAAMRGEPNALGIPTKASPTTFLYDNEESPATMKAREKWKAIGEVDFINDYGWDKIVIPVDTHSIHAPNIYGITIGNGLAKMPLVCPYNYSLMLNALHKVIERYSHACYDAVNLFEG